MLHNLQGFKLCVNKMFPPAFPGVTIRKLTRSGYVPVDRPTPQLRLHRIVPSTPEERKALMRFAFALKGSNVSVQPDLPLADRLKLKEALKSRKSRRQLVSKAFVLWVFSWSAASQIPFYQYPSWWRTTQGWSCRVPSGS
ncbi:unnamed protein product, partial [Dicrocoelium dendriticum]